MSRLAPVTSWFTSRSARERWLIGIMLALAVPLLCYFAFYLPLTASIERAQQRHAAAVRNHGLVLSRLAQLEQAEGQTAATPVIGNAPLSLRVTEAAALAGLSLSSNEPRGAGSAVITLAPAAPTTALGWLRQLQDQGIIVRELGITPQPNGQVVVTATLSQAGAS